MNVGDGSLTGNLSAMQAEAQRVWTSKIYCSPDRLRVDRPAVQAKYGGLLSQ